MFLPPPALLRLIPLPPPLRLTMNRLYGLFTYSGTPKQTQESQALEAISIHQSEKIRELEQKRRQIDRELEEAHKMLRMSQSRDNSVEPGAVASDHEASAQ
jgi:hypothetical protein